MVKAMELEIGNLARALKPLLVADPLDAHKRRPKAADSVQRKDRSPVKRELCVAAA